MRPRRISPITLWLFLALAGAGPVAAQSPFAGTWRLNQDLSQLAGDNLKFRPAEGNAIELAAGGMTYSFRTDGGNYRMPTGDVAIWRETSPGSWTTEYRTIEGKLLRTDNWKLSADEKNLDVTTSGVKANGDLYTDTEDYVRTEGASGLIGSWKGTQVKLSSPSDFIIQEAGLDGLLLKIPALKASALTNFDGKEVEVQGPDLPSGLRLSLTRTGPYSFHLVQKLNGSLLDSAVYTVSEDGERMTEVGGAPGDPPATVVWEKQSPVPPARTADRPPVSPVIPPPGVH